MLDDSNALTELDTQTTERAETLHVASVREV